VGWISGDKSFTLAGVYSASISKEYVFMCRFTVWFVSSLLLAGSVLISGSLLASPDFYPIPDVPARDAPGASLQRFIERDGELTLSEALSAPFETIDGFTSRGYAREAEWYRFALQEGAAGHERLLEFGSLYLNQIDVYLLRPEQPPQQAEHYLLGDHVPMSQRPLKGRSFALTLSLQQGERVTVYARVQSNSAMTFFAMLWNREDFDLYHAQFAVTQGVYFGLIGGLLMGGLLLALLFRRREYIAFSALGLALLIQNIGVSGYVRLLLPEAPGWLPDAVGGVGTLGIVAGAGLIFIYLLDLRLTRPPLYWLTLLPVVLALIGMPFVTSDLYYLFAENLLGVNVLLALLFSIITIYRAWRNRSLVMMFFALCFVSAIVGGGVVMLAISGVIPSSNWALSAYQLSTVMQMVLLAVGLSIEWRQEVRLQSRLEERTAIAESQAEQQQNLTRFLSNELMTPLAAAKRALEMVIRQSAGLNGGSRRRLERASARLVEIEEMARFFLVKRIDAVSERPLSRGDTRLQDVLGKVMDLQDDVIRMQSNLRERTEKAESSVEQQKNLTRFLSHELMTPLAASKRALEMVTRQSGEFDGENRSRIERARGRLDEMEEMARFFLGRRSDMESEISLATEQMSLCKVIDKAIALLGDVEGLSVRYECDPDAEVSGPTSLFAHAIRNLIDNTMRHGGGVCRVTASLGSDGLVVGVEDDGPGMETDSLATITEGRVSAQGSVSGLGLVKFFMQLHGGKMRMINRPQGGLYAEVVLPNFVIPEESASNCKDM
jgi:signal transduction histidine kinase